MLGVKNVKSCFERNVKQCDYRYEVLTFAKLSVHFTECFGGQVHEVLYVCTGEPRRTWGIFPGMVRVLFHIGVRTLYAKGIFREKWGL